MNTIVFIDDRPCSGLRPCSFNDALFLRDDVIPILIRFRNQKHCEEYLNKTSKQNIYTVNNEYLISEEITSFKIWCKERGLIPDSFCCMSEPKQIFGQAFGRLLGLHGMPEKVTEALRHKPTMKDWIRDAGFQTAYYSKVNTLDDIISFGNKHGYPLVVKPTSGWGTLATSVLLSEDEAIKYHMPSDFFCEMMVETFIGLREYECCALIQNGEVLDVYPSYMPKPPIEAANGDINANISYGGRKDEFPINLLPVVKALAIKFKLSNGYLHMEFFMDDQGKELIISELAFRYPGCEIAKNHGLALGFDIANITLDIYLGKCVNLDYKRKRCVGDLLLPYKAGKIRDVSSNDDILRLEGVLECHIGVNKDDFLPEEIKSSFKCSGWVFVEGENVQEVENRMYNVLKNYLIITDY